MKTVKNLCVLFLLWFWADPSFGQQEFKLTPIDGHFADGFGHSVSINCKYAVIGAHQHDSAGIPSSGAAYIYERRGTGWIPFKKLLAGDPDIGDNFGVSVAINGDYVIIGAFLNDGVAHASGSAYIFHGAEDTWQQVDKLTASDGQESRLVGKPGRNGWRLRYCRGWRS